MNSRLPVPCMMLFTEIKPPTIFGGETSSCQCITSIPMPQLHRPILLRIISYSYMNSGVCVRKYSSYLGSLGSLSLRREGQIDCDSCSASHEPSDIAAKLSLKPLTHKSFAQDICIKTIIIHECTNRSPACQYECHFF